MKREMKTILLTGMLILGFSLAIPIGAFAVKPVDWMTEISEHIDIEYTERLMEDMVAIGSSDLGFRCAGTPAEHETVDYILDEMNAIGLEEVDKEPVPVHAWEFISAKLTVESPIEMEIVASSFAGVQGAEPLTGELVYVGSSYSSDYEGLNVEGKIVLSNWDGYDIWIDAVGMMAYLHGAAGIVVSCMDSIYGQGPYALQCHDANWDPDNWPPLIYIPKEYGYQLVEMLESGEEVVVTMESEINLDFNAVGYNTIGYIPGKNYGTEDDEFIIVGDHHDAWFTGAGDDTSGTAATLAMAKAIIDSGYQPESTWIFTTHTAEEYGTTNVYFDWCVGAWYQITREHPDWAGKAIAYLNLEIQGLRGCPFGVDTPVDLFPFINKVVNSNKNIMPNGINVKVNKQISTWNDGWTFTAAGVPGITTCAWEEKDVEYELSGQNIYHTQLDNMDAIDFEYMEACLYINLAIVVALDQEPIIPYSFSSRATDFACTWDALEVASTGVDSYLVNAVDNAAQEFEMLASEWQDIKQSIDESEIDAVNKILLEVNKIIEDGFTAMDIWEISKYPHQQPIQDSTWLQIVIDELEDGAAAIKSAIKHLKWWVGEVWYYDYVDYEYYIHDAIAIHSPDNWGEQVQLGEIVDTWDVIVSLEEKLVTGDSDFSEERAMLEDAKEVALENLENALIVLLDTFTEANILLQQIT